MGKKANIEKKLKKLDYWKKLWNFLDNYKKVLVVKCDNVGSRQFQEIRKAIRPFGAHILMGKKTLLRAGVYRKMVKPEEGDYDFDVRGTSFKPMPELDRLASLCKGNIGLIFCGDNVAEIKSILSDYKREKGAKVGAIAPDDVYIKSGSTGLDPKQTAFFQALNIPTKIVRTQIEIMSDVKIIEAGKKIGTSECALLDKLGIKPFVYFMRCSHVYDNGSVFSADVLDISEEDVVSKFQKGCSYLSAASIQLGLPNTLTVFQSILRGFKQLVSVSIETDVSFKQAEKIKEIAQNPEAYLQQTEEIEVEEKVEIEEPKEEPKEEEVDLGGVGGLFGDDDDEY